ncbi:MAG: hypothetical protein KAS88_04005 [Deltaproteobacteria bacterium]|nr:hypothetical protein [Deltaproteobacteria bacterium]
MRFERILIACSLLVLISCANVTAEGTLSNKGNEEFSASFKGEVRDYLGDCIGGDVEGYLGGSPPEEGSPEEKRCKKGLSMMEELEKKYPENKAVVEELMNVHCLVSRNRCLYYARRLIEIDPVNGEAHYMLAHFASLSDDEIIYHLRIIVESGRGHPYAAGDLAGALFYQGKTREAVDVMKKQIVYNSDSPGILMFTDTLNEKGLSSEAEELYETVLVKSESTTPILLRRVCDSFEQMALVNKQAKLPSKKILDIYIEKCKERAYFELGKKIKNPVKKTTYYRKAVEIMPDLKSKKDVDPGGRTSHEYHIELQEDMVKDILNDLTKEMGNRAVTNELFLLAKILGEGHYRKEEISIYKKYLVTGIEKKEKCTTFKKIKVDEYSKYKDFIELHKKMCGNKKAL